MQFVGGHPTCLLQVPRMLIGKGLPPADISRLQGHLFQACEELDAVFEFQFRVGIVFTADSIDLGAVGWSARLAGK